MEGYRDEPSSDPDEMAQEFTELVNDLGYASGPSSTWQSRSNTVALTGFASRTYSIGIYKNKENVLRIITFWRRNRITSCYTKTPLVNCYTHF